MELKVLIAAISELKATRTTRTTKVKTAGEAAREGEVESLERIGSGLIGLLARVLATVVLGATLYTSRPPYSPTLIRQDLVRLRDFLELLLSLLLGLLLGLLGLLLGLLRGITARRLVQVLVHVDVATLELLSVHLKSLLHRLLRGETDDSLTARSVGVSVLDDEGLGDFTVLGELLVERLVGGLEGEV